MQGERERTLAYIFLSIKCVMHREAQNLIFHALNTTVARSKKIILKDSSDPVLVPLIYS